MIKRIDAARDTSAVRVSMQIKTFVLGDLVPEGDHFAKLPSGIDVQQRSSFAG